jgi:COX assembly mitochondrial protein 1
MSMAAPVAPPTGPMSDRKGLPSRNPIPLSAAQEAQVRETYYKRVRTICADEIKGESSSGALDQARNIHYVRI